MLVKTVIETIRDEYPKLHKAERKVADYILEHPDEVVNYNVADLAEKSHVSDATVVRVCQRLGYSGYYQIRISLAQEQGSGKQPGNGTTDGQVQDQGIIRMFSSLAKDLTAMGRSVDLVSFRDFIEALEHADTVYIVAVGNSLPIGRHMDFHLGRNGIRSVCDADQVYFMNHINLAKREDAVLAISISGSSKTVLNAVDLAKQKGLKVLALTEDRNSPLAKQADICLFSSAPGTAFDLEKIYSHVNEIAMINVISMTLRRSAKWKSSHKSANDFDQMESLLSENKI